MADFAIHNDLHKENFLFALCDLLKEGAVIIERPAMKVVYCNKAWLSLFDFTSPDEIEPDQLLKLRKHILTAGEIAERDNILEEKGIFKEEVEYVSRKGHTFWGEISVRSFKQNDVQYYLAVIEPVDKSKKAETLIAQGERRLEAFLEHASMGIVETNIKGEITAINRFALNLFGYDKEELLDKPVERLIPGRFHQDHITHREKYVKGPMSRPMGIGMDLFAVKKDGAEFPVEVSLSHYNRNGDTHIIAFISDISIRKKAEAEIKKLKDELEITVEQRTRDLTTTMQQLEVSKDKLEETMLIQEAILNNAGAMIISTDINGIIQTFNPEAEKELGYTAEELAGRQMPLVFHDSEEIARMAGRLTKELKQVIPAGIEVFFARARMGLHNEFEWTYIRKDGSGFPVLLNVTALRDDNNELLGYLSVAFNISEQKKTEKKLQQSLEKEKDLSELKSRFVSMASHEFRTPLSTILSSAYLIEKYTASDEQPKREKHLQRIISSVNMLTSILNDFLSVGKIEEGKMQVRPNEFSIRDLLIAISGEMKTTLKTKQKIHYNHQGTSVVWMDSSLLKHIVMNLVSNASKFSPEKSLIEIKTTCREEVVVLSVKDHGMGISKEDQKHLMERFFRGANAGNIQGTGLGLHIVAKYAELMNGAVQCKSEPEKGTEFVITFRTKQEQV
jgi:PAS domain S-box-containing protein